METKTLAGFGIGLIAGVIIGGVVALLYAPKSGEETRETLKSKALETRDHVKDFGVQTVEKVKAAAVEVGRNGEVAVPPLKS